MARLGLAAAVNSALDVALGVDPDVFLLGRTFLIRRRGLQRHKGAVRQVRRTSGA